MVAITWLRENHIGFEYAPIKIGTIHMAIFELLRIRTNAHVLHIHGQNGNIVVHRWDRGKYISGNDMVELYPDTSHDIDICNPNAMQEFCKIIELYR